MSDELKPEEKTDPAGPFAKVMRRLLEEHEKKLLGRLDAFEKLLGVVQIAYVHRVREC